MRGREEKLLRVFAEIYAATLLFPGHSCIHFSCLSNFRKAPIHIDLTLGLACFWSLLSPTLFQKNWWRILVQDRVLEFQNIFDTKSHLLENVFNGLWMPLRHLSTAWGVEIWETSRLLEVLVSTCSAPHSTLVFFLIHLGSKTFCRSPESLWQCLFTLCEEEKAPLATWDAHVYIQTHHRNRIEDILLFLLQWTAKKKIKKSPLLYLFYSLQFPWHDKR